MSNCVKVRFLVTVVAVLVSFPITVNCESIKKTHEISDKPRTSCNADEVPYYASGCEGPGILKCWPQAIRPTPMEACLCNGQTGNAPLPGGGLRWKHAGKCQKAEQ